MSIFADLRSLANKFHHLKGAQKGVAAVEFALILPFILMLYMGSIEVTQVIVMDRKLASVASTVGDLVARSNGEVSQATVDDFFEASRLILRPYPSGALKQLVTSVRVETDGTTSVQWSRGFNGATAKTTNASYDLPDEITDIASGSYVIVSEAQIVYQPWGAYFFDTGFNLYRQYFHMPRFGEAIDLE